MSPASFHTFEGPVLKTTTKTECLCSIYIQNISKMGQQNGLMGKSALTLVQFLETIEWQERTECYFVTWPPHECHGMCETPPT